MEREKEREIRERVSERTRTKKVHRYEVRGMRERERKGGREIELDSKLEKIVEQNITYTYLS